MKREENRRPRSLQALRAEVDRWNSAYRVGTRVTLTKDDGTEVDAVTRSEASVLSGHTAVIWLRQVVGCWALDRVRAARGVVAFERTIELVTAEDGGGWHVALSCGHEAFLATEPQSDAQVCAQCVNVFVEAARA